MNKWLLLSAGGIAGTISRYLLASWVPGIAGVGFPWGTFLVNLSACLLIGVLSGMAGRGALGPDGRLLLMTGFCGAYSTFSTLMLETSTLAADGELLRAGLNYLGSGVAGLVLFRVGLYLGTIF